MYMKYFLLIRYLDMEKRYKQEMERRRGVTADFKVCINFSRFQNYWINDNQVRYLVLKNQSLHNWYKYYINEFFNKLISLKLLLPKEYLYLKNVSLFFVHQSTLTWIKQISYICYNCFCVCVTNRNYKTIIGGLWITRMASSTQITWCISATWEWGWQRSE